MNYVFFLGFCDEPLAARVTSPGDVNNVQLCYFLYLLRNRNLRAWFPTSRR